MDLLRVPRVLILFCAVTWVLVQRSMQRSSPHKLSTDVQPAGSFSTPAEVLDMGDSQKSASADNMDHLRTQTDEPTEEQRKRRVKRFGGRSRRSKSDNRAKRSQNCRQGGPRDFCALLHARYCGWKKFNFGTYVMEEDWEVQLENGMSRGFLASELACPTGGETHCLTFDYKMDEPNRDQLLVFLYGQEKRPVTLWRTWAEDEPRGWNTAHIAIRSRTAFQVEISVIRWDPEQKFLSPVFLRNIHYRQVPCGTTSTIKPLYESPSEASSSGSRHTSAVTSPVSYTPVTPSVLTTSGMSLEMTSVPDMTVDTGLTDDDDDKEGIMIAAVGSCAVVVMALLVMAIVCWRRRSRNRTTSAPSTVMPSGAQSQDAHPDARNIPGANMAADNILLEDLDATGRRQASRDVTDDMPDYDNTESSVHVYANTGGNVTSRSANAVSGMERGAHRHATDDAPDYENINDRVYDLPGRNRNAPGMGRRQRANRESQHIYMAMGSRNLASDGGTPSCQVL